MVVKEPQLCVIFKSGAEYDCADRGHRSPWPCIKCLRRWIKDKIMKANKNDRNSR